MNKLLSTTVPLCSPSLPNLEELAELLREPLETGMVTSGRLTTELENKVRSYLGVDHAVAVSSCTSGLIVSLRAMDLPSGSEVVVPSFTFAATVQALIWNGLTPMFVDCDPFTLTVDPAQVERALNPRTAAIFAVNIFGLPPNIDALQETSHRRSIPLVFDSAQGLGSRYRDRLSGGFGLWEVFSFSPTKVVSAIEGGIVTTNDGRIADRVRCMRDYGKGPDGQEMEYIGLSARMSELHAAVGVLNMDRADDYIAARSRLAKTYRDSLRDLPGISFQELPEDRSSSLNYFIIRIGPEARATRNSVIERLQSVGIQSKRYFFPPVHQQHAFAARPHGLVDALPNTVKTSSEALALPFYAHMTDEEQERVVTELRKILAP